MTTETLIYSNYLVYEKKQSEIDADLVHDVAIGFTCPRCKTPLNPIMEHAEVRSCPSCNLTMELHGNALVCSTSPLSYPKYLWRD